MKNLENKLKIMALACFAAFGFYGCELLNKKQDIGRISCYAQNSEQVGQINALADISDYNKADDCDMVFEKIEVSDGKTWTNLLDKIENVNITNDLKSQIGATKPVAAGQYHAIRLTFGDGIYIRSIYNTGNQGHPPYGKIAINEQYNGVPNQIRFRNGLMVDATNVITLSSADQTLIPFDVESESDIYNYFNIKNNFRYTFDADTLQGHIDGWEELHFDMWTSRMAP